MGVLIMTEIITVRDGQMQDLFVPNLSCQFWSLRSPGVHLWTAMSGRSKIILIYLHLCLWQAASSKKPNNEYVWRLNSPPCHQDLLWAKRSCDRSWHYLSCGNLFCRCKLRTSFFMGFNIMSFAGIKLITSKKVWGNEHERSNICSTYPSGEIWEHKLKIREIHEGLGSFMYISGKRMIATVNACG